ncbi:hypothetical protein JOQ06_023743 [Pogonophryne albipinna]|uniref:BEN domain-containing protein n=1 Tax=Pogonophryne albipinna TaxID=1090488 RepID=A0AAD6FUL7_9TELE|nr:hypothetical protein JOQ06_023743 [Pogonophryne albipinna]
MVDFGTVSKPELNSLLRQFYGSVRNTKGQQYAISAYAMPHTDSESELDQTLSKSELQTQLDIANYKNEELKRENSMLRKSLSLFQELPSLLDQVRELNEMKAHHPRNIQDGSQDNATMEKDGTSSEEIKTEQQGAGDMVELAEGVTIKNNVLARLSKDPKKKVTELMSVFFTRQLMASSSLSGKQTNAWRSLDAKKQLDPNIVAAIAKYVQEKHSDFTFKDVTNVMRTKLNNESKNRAMKTEGTFSGAELLGDSHGD